MKKRIACLFVVALAAFSSTASYGEEKAGDAAALFEQKCSGCHGTDRPKSKKKTKDEWQSTVARMKVNGCPITDDEAARIVDYLAKTFGK